MSGGIKTMEDAYSYYEGMMDEEGPIEIAGIEFFPSQILKEMDPIAYRTGFNDYMDAIGVDTDELEEE